MLRTFSKQVGSLLHPILRNRSYLLAYVASEYRHKLNHDEELK